MIVTCPRCDTHFSVPEAAFGRKGRTVRCARCGNKWFLTPDDRDEDPPEDDIPMEMAPAQAPVIFADPFAEEPAPEPGPAGVNLLQDVTFDFDSSTKAETETKADAQDKDKDDEDPFADIAELMSRAEPDPIPDIFSSPGPKPVPKRRGGVGLWLLFLLLLLGAGGIGLYLFQDWVIERFPATQTAYEQVGLRNKVVGAGLAFRNIDSERVMQQDAEVLIVRGVIANTTDKTRDIPALKLALFNNDKPLQEKVILPPQPGLDAKAAVGFRVTLERPDPEATRFEVTFTLPVEQPER